MDWTLELVVVPVSNVDRAKAFCTDQLGFRVDRDRRSEGDRSEDKTEDGLKEKAERRRDVNGGSWNVVMTRRDGDKGNG